MKTIVKKITGYMICLLALLFCAAEADCQAYEIRLINSSANTLRVEMRETSGVSPKVSDYITDIVFGIKWKGGNLDLAGNISTAYYMKKSGVRLQKNDYYYQAFYADPVGYLTPVNWQQNAWIEILSVTLAGNGAGLFQIAEKGFDVTTDPNFALNFVDYTPNITGDIVAGPLPVNLTRFEVMPVNRMIQVQWSTDNEQNSKGFQVQRSDEKDLNNFKDIGWVNSKGSGNGKNEYAYMDKDVIAKLRYSYRLKQIDKDGQFKYSEIRTAVLDELDNAFISLAPNPADKVLQVIFSSGVETGNVVIKVLDVKGAVMITQNQYMSPGTKAELNVMLLADGAYFLVIENRNGLLYKKVFKKG